MSAATSKTQSTSRSKQAQVDARVAAWMNDLRTGRKHAYYAFLLPLTPNTNGWGLKNRGTWVEGIYKNRGAWLNGYVRPLGMVVEAAYCEHDYAAEVPDYVQVVYKVVLKQHQDAALVALAQRPLTMSQRFKHDRKATSAVTILPRLTLLELERKPLEEAVNETTLSLLLSHYWLGVKQSLHKQTLGTPWYE